MTKSSAITAAIYGNLLRVLRVRFQKGTFLRNVSIVMSGTAIGQLGGFLLMPVVSRLFAPSDFGVLGSYNSILGVFAAAATLQYSQAIMLPKRKEDAINLFIVSCLSVALITSLCLVGVILFPATIQTLIKAPSIVFLFLLPFAVLVTGLNQSLQAWCIRVKAFKHASASQVIRSLSAVGIWIAAGFNSHGAMGLVLGSVCADILASLNLMRVLRHDQKETRSSLSLARMKQLAHEFRDFPMFAAPQNLMNALSQGLPVLLLGYYCGVGVAGAYAFGVRILNAPMVLILTPLQQVLFQKLSEGLNHGARLYPMFVKTTGALIAIALLPCSILFAWSPQMFSWIFGREWLEAGIYARWLTLWFFASFIRLPSVLLARILRQQRNLFLYECMILISRTIILVVGGLSWTTMATIVSFSVLGFILNLAFIVWIGILLCHNR